MQKTRILYILNHFVISEISSHCSIPVSKWPEYISKNRQVNKQQKVKNRDF